jgi:hypothetical protein
MKHKCTKETMMQMFIGSFICTECLHPPRASKYEPKPEAEKEKRGARPEPN